MENMFERLNQKGSLKSDIGRFAKIIKEQSLQLNEHEQRGMDKVKAPNSPISIPEAKKAKTTTIETIPSRTKSIFINLIASP